MVKVPAEDGDMGMIGAESGPADCQGTLVLGKGAGQVTMGDQDVAEVTVQGGYVR